MRRWRIPGTPDRKDAMHPITKAALIALALAASGATRAEQGPIKQGEETFKINLGGIRTQTDSTLRLDGSRGQSREVDLEDAGLSDSSTGFLGSATWRFAPRHRVGVQTFSLERSGSKTTAQQIELGDSVVPAGTSLSADSKAQFLIANYQYSFIKTDRLEFAGMVGIYGARYKFSFDAASPAIDVDRNTDVPLPLLGASLDYFVTQRWTVSVFLEAMKMKIGDVEGRVYYGGISTDYMITRHFGLGVGYALIDLQTDLTKGDFQGEIDWRSSSVFAHAQFRF
jgi:hypothetical protein